jgi:hypothetical protein
MSDLAAQIERKLDDYRLAFRTERLPKNEFLVPHYDGYSIVNIPATAAALLGVPLPDLRPLAGEIWESFTGGVRCVVQIIIDALGYRRLQRHMAAEPDSPFHHLLHWGGQLIPLTSVCPSTTTSALSSLWTGRTPAEHGMLGTRLFLRDRGLRANMIFFTPVDFERHGLLVKEGMEPSAFLGVPGFAESLAQQGIETHVFIDQRYTAGGLSEIFFRGVKEVHAFVEGSTADLWIGLCRFMEERATDRFFVSVYWGQIDTLAHVRGPASSAVDAELRGWTRLMLEEFLEPLSAGAKSGAVLTILADHGQVGVTRERTVRLDRHPQLFEHLLMKPLGEQRLSYLFARQGHKQVVRRYVQENLSYAFAVLDSEQALEAGIFGSEEPAQETTARIGDLILIARQNHILFDQEGELHLRGLHGGLSPEEMLVPYLLMRLDQ